MKILRSWLNDYIKTNKSDDEIADLLTFSGTLVEEVIKSVDSHVIAAKIIEIKKHPNADKLQIALVDTGQDKIEIVCGAPNIKVGQIVPLATIGSKLGEFEIKEAVIRGIKSNGMLCSEKELGLGEDHSGILILGESTALGTPINQLVPNDSIFDIEITPNRGDCLSHIGIARELSAVLGKRLEYEVEGHKVSDDKTLKIEILSPEKCYRYHGMIIKNVKVGPSPSWLQKRVEAMGGKSINNLVDITNYIMFDLGQPLHAFDRSKIEDDHIIVRNAGKDEEFTTLDGQTYQLEDDMLVIADPKKALALAGVMGGMNSEVDEDTKEIILESAEFDSRSIRKTSKHLGVVTEASYRFERKIDPAMTESALDKAASLICELCGGKIVSKKVEVANNYENEWVPIESEKISDLLGNTFTKDQVIEYLELFSFKVKDGMAQAPAFRHDVSIWQDLAEEVARIFDINNLPLAPDTKNPSEKRSSYHFKEHIKDLLENAGFTEVFTYPFLSDADIKSIGLDPSNLLQIANPIQPENKYLRNSLLPNLFRTVAKNPIFDPVLIFEVANVFSQEEEHTNLGVVASGKNAEKAIGEAAKILANNLKIDQNIFKIDHFSREELQRFKIKKPNTYYLEIPIEKLEAGSKVGTVDLKLTISNKVIHYRPISKYPSITRDLAFIVDKSLASQTIIDLMYDQSELINRVELFDEFASDKFGLNKKNIAFHIHLQHAERTMTDKEAEEIIGKIIEAVKEKFKGELRTY